MIGRRIQQALRQCLAFHEFHYEKVRAVLFSYIMERANVGMVQRGDRPRLLLERAVGALQRLDGDDPVEAGIARLPDFAHASSAQGGEDLVGADDAAGMQ
jgi:hypothetical protein